MPERTHGRGGPGKRPQHSCCVTVRMPPNASTSRRRGGTGAARKLYTVAFAAALRARCQRGVKRLVGVRVSAGGILTSRFCCNGAEAPSAAARAAELRR